MTLCWSGIPVWEPPVRASQPDHWIIIYREAATLGLKIFKYACYKIWNAQPLQSYFIFHHANSFKEVRSCPQFNSSFMVTQNITKYGFTQLLNWIIIFMRYNLQSYLKRTPEKIRQQVKNWQFTAKNLSNQSHALLLLIPMNIQHCLCALVYECADILMHCLLRLQ